MSDSSERTALYRYLDADGALLYVGISNDPDFRWKAHLYGVDRRAWPRRAASRTAEWYDSRAAALTAEEAAIHLERPAFNRTHNYDDVEFDPASWPTVERGRKIEQIAALIRSEIATGRWRVGQRLPSIRIMTEATGASQQIVSKASARLQREGLLVFESGRGLFVTARPKLPHDFFQKLGFPG